MKAIEMTIEAREGAKDKDKKNEKSTAHKRRQPLFRRRKTES